MKTTLETHTYSILMLETNTYFKTLPLNCNCLSSLEVKVTVLLHKKKIKIYKYICILNTFLNNIFLYKKSIFNTLI